MTAQSSVLVVLLGTGNSYHPRQLTVPAVLARPGDDVIEMIGNTGLAVVVVGPGLDPDDVSTLIAECRCHYQRQVASFIVVGFGARSDAFQDLIADDELFYLSARDLAPADLDAIVEAAAHLSSGRSNSILSWPRDQGIPEGVLDFLVRMSPVTDLDRAVGRLTAAASELLPALSARCLFYDDQRGELWTSDQGDDGASNESAATGLVGFVARTALPLTRDRLGDDPRYDAESDGPDPDARFVALPILGIRGQVIAVVTAVRRGRSAAFAGRDRDLLSLLAACAAPTFMTFLAQREIEHALWRHTPPIPGGRATYRDAALRFHFHKSRGEGPLLLAGAGAPLFGWLPPLLAAAAVIVAVFAQTTTYARGPAVLRVIHGVRAELVAWVPASYASSLRPGMLGMVRFPDVTDMPLPIQISAVSGQSAPTSAPPLPADHSYVEIHASFDHGSGGRLASYVDGMRGEVQVGVKSSLAASLLPSLIPLPRR